MFIRTSSETHLTHAVAFRTVVEYVRVAYQVSLDLSCKDLTRCCFVSWDPGAFYNADAVPLTLIDGLSDTSDTGRAQRFLDRFYPVTRYVPQWRRWLVFMGGKWHGDKDGAEFRLVEKVWIPELKEEFEQWLDKKFKEVDDHWLPGDIDGISNQPDPLADDHRKDADKQKKAFKAAVEKMLAKYTNIDPLEKMFKMASTSADVIIEPTQVDGHKTLVGVKNGYIDLKTGEFFPYNSDVVITKSMNATYHAGSRCPMWEQFMREVLPNKRVRAFVAKAMGYCLTGDLNKGIMFLWGTGDNGKSVFLDVLFTVFGDYAMRTSPKLLYTNKYMDDVPEHQKAELFGKRLAVGNEVSENARLNEAAVKEVTGESTTSGCRKYEHPFTFQQTAKIWIAGNHSPVVKGTDNAIWGRINKVHFPATFDKTKNTDIRERLLEESSGILNWLVNACRHCLRNGNKPPREVIRDVEEYRREEDILREFVDDYLWQAEGSFVEVSEAYRVYQQWAKETGLEHPLTRRRLVRELKSRGLDYGHDSSGNRRGFRNRQINPDVCASNTGF